jgi:hypothetical protein
VAGGEGNRVLYGVIDPLTGFAAPARRSSQFGQVLEMRNADGDRAVSLSVQLQKRFAGGVELSLAYAHTEARDRLSASQDALDADFGGVPLDGSLENRRLATALWSVPHKITAVAMVPLGRGIRAALFYVGSSGTPYSYVVRGDVNADGIGDRLEGRDLFNDVVYVPTGPGDISLDDPAEYAELARVIDGERCLRTAIGSLMRRNACRNSWITVTNARLSKVFALSASRSIEILADAFNLLALAGTRWGEVRETAGGNAVPLLELVGYDEPAGRGIYRVMPVERNALLSEASRWRVQLGARMSF